MDTAWTDAAIARAVREAEAVQHTIIRENGCLDAGYRALAKGIAEFEQITNASAGTMLFDSELSRRFFQTHTPEDFWLAYRDRLRRTALPPSSGIIPFSQRTDVTAQDFVKVLVSVVRPGINALPVLGPAAGIILGIGMMQFWQADDARRAA